MATSHVVSKTQFSTENLSMDFGWGSDGYAARYSISDLTNTNMSMAHGVGDDNLG
jgi:hypothetical protein